ncbi:MAG: D-alanine--D-alanine ligase [Bacteroidia bacterium]|nr:D-alanine--D-alanine ligase [Bacteroidia bacterium]
MDKIRLGIFFGGKSREREVSFAGGRTVYDNLNKSLFEPIPVFIDSFGNFCILDWKHIYKGTIRDFFPPAEDIPSHSPFQYYIEYLNTSPEKHKEILTKVGRIIHPQEFTNYFDLVFLCLHGEGGEDGTIQGLLEYYNIPYTGSGILPSAFGMNKSVQKKWMKEKNFHVPKQKIFTRQAYFSKDQHTDWLAECKMLCGLPFVVKPANQGSSIGVSVVRTDDAKTFEDALERAFFVKKIRKKEWHLLSDSEKIKFILNLTDIRNGIAFPAFVEEEGHFRVIHSPDECLQSLNDWTFRSDEILLQGTMSESEVIVEEFLGGREFSCIVFEKPDGTPVALPPTEILKGDIYYDYRSKYLPGLSRKVTPMELDEAEIQKIRRECERLFAEFQFDVYARIDGFYLPDGRIFLNDPNTTSGMMPSSFFFHQAAEIGLNPSELITFIIHTSLKKNLQKKPGSLNTKNLFNRLDHHIRLLKKAGSRKQKVAVLLGGYSSERHISVESGRNVFEKLSSSEKYEAFPIFLTGKPYAHRLFIIPLPLLLKDNADDIRDSVLNYKKPKILIQILNEAKEITALFSTPGSLSPPKEITYDELKNLCDIVFIGLHGSPGENGEVQTELEQRGIPYNGSGPKSSSITIHKYHTNEILKQHGILVAQHLLIKKKDWLSHPEETLKHIEKFFPYPLIAKPPDDGCSSAVKKIKNKEEMSLYLNTAFRDNPEIPEIAKKGLNLKPNEEFPLKEEVLIEELIGPKGADHFLEITGGMLTKFDEKGNRIYEVFEASEAVATGDVLSLEEKFLAGEGLNITPARYSPDPVLRQNISNQVKNVLQKTAEILDVEGYCRIDAFVRIYGSRAEVIIVEINSLPGMTPATCIFHQAAIQNYKPVEFIDLILQYGIKKSSAVSA